MNTRAALTLTTVLPLLILLPILPAAAGAHILDLRSGQHIPLAQMLEDVRNARLVYVGELHDQPAHHMAQLEVIRALHEGGKPIAIGLEMVREKSQAALDDWVEGKLDEGTFRRVFEKNWGMWDQYAEILRYARQEKIPLVGLNIPREITRKVAQEGYDSLSVEEARAIPGVSCDVDDRYRNYIRRSLGGHGHNGATFENFCEAQMVWDTAMAQNLVQYLRRQPNRTVVVLAGSGHAWRFGIPAQVERQLSVPYRILLPEIPGRFEGSFTTDEADYLLQGLAEGPLH